MGPGASRGESSVHTFSLPRTWSSPPPNPNHPWRQQGKIFWVPNVEISCLFTYHTSLTNIIKGCRITLMTRTDPGDMNKDSKIALTYVSSVLGFLYAFLITVSHRCHMARLYRWIRQPHQRLSSRRGVPLWSLGQVSIPRRGENLR